MIQGKTTRKPLTLVNGQKNYFDTMHTVSIYFNLMVISMMEILSTFSCKSMIAVFVKALTSAWKRELTRGDFIMAL